MISTELLKGQGLGNQLWCYVVTRVLAHKHGYKFSIQKPENFKGSDFLNLDFGEKTLPPNMAQYIERPVLNAYGSDIRDYDKDLVEIKDNTNIFGYVQDERYIEEHKELVRAWLTVKPEHDCHDFAKEDICVINFRGSGYVSDKEFFLPPRYWNNAIKNMRKINPHFRFVVITEDVKTAQVFFPDFEVHHFDIGKDYSVIKNAHYLILSNSSFAWFPTWLNTNLKFCIAPKYWARHNISDGYWSLGYNITKGWQYQDRKGLLSDYETCLHEYTQYKNQTKKRQSLVSILGRDYGFIHATTHVILVSTIKHAMRLRDAYTPHVVEKSTTSTGADSKPAMSHKKSVRQHLKNIVIKIGYY